jgi:hypothetical protein
VHSILGGFSQPRADRGRFSLARERAVECRQCAASHCHPYKRCTQALHAYLIIQPPADPRHESGFLLTTGRWELSRSSKKVFSDHTSGYILVLGSTQLAGTQHTLCSTILKIITISTTCDEGFDPARFD